MTKNRAKSDTFFGLTERQIIEGSIEYFIFMQLNREVYLASEAFLSANTYFDSIK
jgi:hypothetical protein